jgi:hypothetical protein
MLKKTLTLLLLPLLFAGCATTLTNLTPKQQTRNAENLYPVEVAFASTEQTLRWGTIKPQILVGTEFYPMHPTQLMTNRWEGLIPVSRQTNVVYYRYKFDFRYNNFGGPGIDSSSR